MYKFLLKSVLSVILFFIFIACVTSTAQAQMRDSLLRVYNNETIHSFGKFYIKGSRQLSFANLNPEFSTGVPRDLYKKSKANLLFGRFLTVTAVAALVTGAIVKKDNKGAALALSIVGIGLNLTSFHFRKKSTELIDQAIWYRNKEILFGAQ